MIDNEKSDGFNFATIAVTGLLGFLSVIYIYFSNYSIEEKWYSYVSILIPITFVSILYFILYIVLYGFSIKMRNYSKLWIKELADIFYISALLFFIITLGYLLSLIASYTNPDENVKFVLGIYILIFLLLWMISLYFSFSFCWDKIPGRDTEKLRQFLVARKNIEWAKKAVVEKIDNGSTIKLSTDGNHLYLKLNKEETNVNLSINNDKYSFCLNEVPFKWRDVPGKDNGRLIKFLARRYGIDWIKAAKIEKTDADKLIIVSTNKKYLLLKLNDDKTTVDLIINGERTDELTVKKIDDLRNVQNINFKGKSFRNALGIILISILFLFYEVFHYRDLLMVNYFLVSFSFIIYFILIRKRYSKWAGLIALLLFLLGLGIYGTSFAPFSYIASGDITTDMNSVYYMNSGPIPVTIHVTGPNSKISIELLKSDRENNLSRNGNDYIEYLEPDHKSNIIIRGNLSANSFGNGKYGLFINATNLSLGYYELNVTRPKNVKTAIKGFYLLNDSKNSFN